MKKTTEVIYFILGVMKIVIVSCKKDPSSPGNIFTTGVNEKLVVNAGTGGENEE